MSVEIVPTLSGNVAQSEEIDKIYKFHLYKKNKLTENDNNMGLRLILPTNSINVDELHFTEDNYLTVSSATGEINTNLKRQTTPRDSLVETESEQDFYNQNINTRNVNINPSYTSDEIYETSRSNEEKLCKENNFTFTSNQTSTKEKNKMFRKHLTKILSCIYTVFIVTLGIVVYISDIIVGNSPIAEQTFSMYLIIIAFVYLIFLIIDIRIYLNKKKASNSLLRKTSQDFSEYPSEASIHFSVPFPLTTIKLEQESHNYCFGRGRHSGSFYLKLGAAGFCFGHLIHSGLLLGYQIIFLTSNSEKFYECASVATLVLDIIYPIYSFLLLYFVFKYSNVIINKRSILAQFAFMHCIAASLCFWVWTILREIMDSLSEYKDYNKNTSLLEIFPNDQPIALALTSYNEVAAHELVRYLNSSLRLSFSSCEEQPGLNLINQNYSPYLYPFSVEYSILVVGILFIIWQNVDNCTKFDNLSTCGSTSNINSDCYIPNNEESNLVIHADCHSANKGLFSGMAILVLCVVTIILFFIAILDERHDLALLVSNVTDIIILLLMTITGIFAYHQIIKLDVNRHPISLLDDLLLFVCIPAFFLSAIFSLVPAIHYGNIFSITSITVKVVQMLVQTPLIIDGLRRCSNTRELRQKKPGRELITFLIVCNVSLWITQTFEIKSYGLQDQRYEFYGKVLWTILGHMTLPFMMFYRFHSSVCLVDIWKSAYEPEGH